ncbi:phosphate ABC transporter substrate-binding protein [Neosynechococcus sphagnicola sy1]|uniref:Phosphate-binding protein n=1 Tax=Neosynechococcus sphagnicola sy1 TaxID=1497020 RepID=A0A098TMD2_9CYAN|nr:phosphate ABC transporter substrate-binding protein PstS [Neosynechococcus sphagnicola]KGF73017.1 phosphate ABC transporter substrate-binding protein [Neosynechococcus sphagnicola sy1]
MQLFSRIPSAAGQALFLPFLALTVGLASCQSNPPQSNTGTGTASPGATVSLSGAGATFPAPLYQRWFADYNKLHPNVQVSYQSVGSGAGVQQFVGGTVDFGASDVGMKPDEVAKVSRGALLLPMTAGGIVAAYNLPDVKDLKLSRENLTAIFQGKITKWNDPKLAKDNAGVTLPDLPIAVIYRSDGSGTTATFTKHLSAISPDWKNGPGNGKSIQWPVGTGAKGNEGVTAQIQQTPGAIGYIEYGYAKENNVTFASLENKAGKFVTYTPESAAAALAKIQLPESLMAFDPDPEGEGSYPIVTYTWVLAYKTYDNPEKAKSLKEVLKWSLTDGQKLSPDLGYVPLPAEVVTKVTAAVDTISP